jgi:hypothetical protein
MSSLSERGGVKVRAELDRVSGVALMPTCIRSTMFGGGPVLEVGSVPFRGGYGPSGLMCWIASSSR